MSAVNRIILSRHGSRATFPKLLCGCRIISLKFLAFPCGA